MRVLKIVHEDSCAMDKFTKKQLKHSMAPVAYAYRVFGQIYSWAQLKTAKRIARIATKLCGTSVFLKDAENRATACLLEPQETNYPYGY